MDRVTFPATGNDAHMRSLTKAALAVGVAGTIAAGCGGSSVVPTGPVDLAGLRKSKIPVFYLGKSFSGHELSYADSPAEKRALVTYGTCKAPAGGSCSPPLEIQTCLKSTTVAVVGDQALAEQASPALRPLNAAAKRIAQPQVRINKGLSCAPS
jgi:hypothetical protein